MSRAGAEGLVIRPMESADVEEAARLEAEIFTMPWSRRGFLEALAGTGNVFLVAEQEGQLLGYCGMYCAGDEGEITNVAVAPGARRQGIGGRLLDQLLLRSEKAGIRQVVLEVRVSNEEAIRLYRKRGFAAAGIRKNFYQCPPEDGYVMIRSQ